MNPSLPSKSSLIWWRFIDWLTEPAWRRRCVCGEINARHCPVHQNPEEETRNEPRWR